MVYTILVCENTGGLTFEASVELLGNVQEVAFCRNFIVAHAILSSIDECRAIGRTNRDISRGAINAGCRCEFCETISINFRNFLSAGKFGCNSAECHAQGLFIVHRINLERNASVLSQGEGFPVGSYGTMREPVVAVIVAETINISDEHFRSVCTNEVDALVEHVQAGSKGCFLINAVKNRLKFLSKNNRISHCHNLLSNCDYNPAYFIACSAILSSIVCGLPAGGCPTDSWGCLFSAADSSAFFVSDKNVI